MSIKIENVDSLNEFEKIFLTHKILDLWQEGKIKKENILFLPKDLNVYNSKDISKVFLICSDINYSEKIESMLKHFLELKFFEQLDFMIYLFDIINDIKIIPNKITDTMDFKKLSDEILKYKLCL